MRINKKKHSFSSMPKENATFVKRRPTNDFYYRLSQVQKLAFGGYQVEEHFWLNRQSPEQIPLQHIYCRGYGECHWKQGTRYEFPSSNSAWAFEYVVGGEAEISYDKVTHRLKAGSIFIHAPGRSLSLRVDHARGLSKKTVIVFGGAADYFCNLAKLGVLPLLEPTNTSNVSQIYDSIKSTAVSGSSFLSENIATLCYSLILELGRILTFLRYPGVMGYAVDCIECKLHTNITLSSLSAECGVSTSTLNRLFKQFLNVSPISYIIFRRLERARHLISIKDLSLKEISSQCGYARESFFSRAFKQRFGVSPNDYRKFLVTHTQLDWPPGSQGTKFVGVTPSKIIKRKRPER